VSCRSALTTVFVERKLPWRVEQWLSARSLVRRYRERRLVRWDHRLYRQFVRTGDLVFDVGANRGDKTAVFLALGARVVAIEPDVRTAAELQTRFAGNSRVVIVEAGLGAASGQIAFHPSPHPTRSTFAVDRMRHLDDGVEFGPGTVVALTTLDALIGAHGLPRFCKIDVEGYEPEVLRGLSQPLPAMSFEFHGELLDDARHCIDKVAALGMRHFNLVLHPIAGHRHQTLDRLYFPSHVSPADCIAAIMSLAAQYRLAGDIWAFADDQARPRRNAGRA
jgi:FkbM family methyltransferase